MWWSWARCLGGVRFRCLAHDMSRTPRIPLTVLGGFLGAGKTTLLNHLLTTDTGRRVAVLVNDFGPINVDAKLIARHDGDTISLTNGCICCSIGSGLDRALMSVLARDPAPDWIVIEASGVSDPGRIAQVGVSDPLLQLEGVIVMVDAEHVLELADDPLLYDTIARQMASADLLVLNKTDLVPEDGLPELKAELGRRYGRMPMVEAVRGRVAIEALMGLPDSLPRKPYAVGPQTDKVHEHGHADHEHTQPDHPFESGSWTCPGVLSADELKQALKQLPRSIIRVKGWVVTDRHGPVIVHFAGRRVRFEPPGEHPSIMDNQLVYIGLREEAMHTALKQALGPLAASCSGNQFKAGMRPVLSCRST